MKLSSSVKKEGAGSPNTLIVEYDREYEEINFWADGEHVLSIPVSDVGAFTALVTLVAREG